MTYNKWPSPNGHAIVSDKTDKQPKSANVAFGAFGALKKELPELMMATYHENKGWNDCIDFLASQNRILAYGCVSVPIEVLNLYDFMCMTFAPMTSQQEQIKISLNKAKAAMIAAQTEKREGGLCFTGTNKNISQ